MLHFSQAILTAIEQDFKWVEFFGIAYFPRLNEYAEGYICDKPGKKLHLISSLPTGEIFRVRGG